MDQRGYSVDPTSNTPFVLPTARLQAWAQLAAHRSVADLVPAQREHLAA
jgi:hypothetical protein